MLYTLLSMPKVDEKGRKRMIVEEVGSETPKEVEETVKDESPSEMDTNSTKEPLEVVKEKVEELQTITEGISESVEKSAEVQEELAKVAEKVSPADITIPVSVDTATTSSINDDFIPLNKSSNGPSPLLIIIPGVLLLGALLGGIVFYQKNVKDGGIAETPVPVESTEPTATATPAPSASVDLSKYTISILNGSGIAGEAGKVKTLLTDAEFKVGTTGNAATYDFTKTVVKAKSSVDSAYVAKLIETLSKTYEVDKAQTLSDSSKDDVQVIVGTSKK